VWQNVSKLSSRRISVPHVEEDAGADEHAKKTNHEEVAHGVRVVIWECDHNVAKGCRSLILSSRRYICEPQQSSDLCGAGFCVNLG